MQPNKPQPNPPLANFSQPIDGTPSGLDKPTRKKRSWAPLIILLTIILIILASLGGGYLWYNQQLLAVDPESDELVAVEIQQGSTADQVGELLEDNGIIRSKMAFMIYTYLSDVRGALQAGKYRLSPADSTETIVGHISSGLVDEFSLTFLPGATLADHKEVIRQAGYSVDEIEEAFSLTYDSPLLADKPATADLEGYIYGETYNFTGDATVADILERTFDEFYSVVQANDLEESFSEQGLTLYQGITLASIIQREVPSAADQRQVAQVFYKRLAEDMPLGSDVTYQYIADKLGVERDINIDSPYNTRRYKGLPPGPIASPGLTALLAVAEPAEGDYLYFVSGDDDINYFSRTYEEHEANIAAHCQIKCSIL